MQNCDVLIVGGGLAGLSAGIHLAKRGIAATVVEKNPYPLHKVCGEYLSCEVLPYLEWLGADVASLSAETITRFSFSTPAGAMVNAVLPLGGIGISRHKLDEYLYQLALREGCKVVQDSVENITFDKGCFSIESLSGSYNAKAVIGAYGKRSALDKGLKRTFSGARSPWLAVKAHYSGTFPEGEVHLHSFKGGYCGASRTEDGSINICYLAAYGVFKKYKDIEAFQEHVLCANPRLKELFAGAVMKFEKPLVVSQLYFEEKLPVERHVLMAGDTAGLIHPLCGNGMAMAIQAGGMASELVARFINGSISREAMEKEYALQWRRRFGRRLSMGRMLSRAIASPAVSGALFGAAALFPQALPAIIRQTHGKPVKPELLWA